MDYEKAYKVLFNAITTAIIRMEESGVFSMPIEEGLRTLKNAQCETEELYINEK